jgi:serine/threonine-protein kinase
LSPDGKRFVFPASSNSDLWIADLTRKTVSRFTFASKFGMAQPVWSPDGDSVVYGSSGALWRKPSSGVGSEIEILRGGGGGNLYPTDWSGDGRILLYYDYGNSFDVLALPMTEASAKPVPLETGPFSEYGARLSPDGRWMSYVSDESGRYEIYVRDFSGQSKAKGKWLLTNDGGSWHRWRPDGREILYVNNARLISVDVDGTRDAFVAGTPKELFRTSPTTYIAGVSKDGQRILMIHSSQYAAEPVTVLLNWESRIPRRAE